MLTFFIILGTFILTVLLLFLLFCWLMARAEKNDDNTQALVDRIKAAKYRQQGGR